MEFTGKITPSPYRKINQGNNLYDDLVDEQGIKIGILPRNNLYEELIDECGTKIGIIPKSPYFHTLSNEKLAKLRNEIKEKGRSK